MFCKNCGKELNDQATFCTACGHSVTGGTRFCSHCGKAILAGAVICTGCGCAVGGGTATTPFVSAADSATLLQRLSDKVKTEAVIWFVIAAIQAFIGILDLLFFDVTSGAILLVICVLNVVAASNDLKYSKDVLTAPSNIVAKYEPITGLIVTLIYNLIFGGVIGVVGTIFGFATRSFVMENKTAFHAYDTV